MKPTLPHHVYVSPEVWSAFKDGLWLGMTSAVILLVFGYVIISSLKMGWEMVREIRRSRQIDRSAVENAQDI